MPTKLEINAKFLDCIAKLQRMMRRTEIVEIRIAANKTFFINDQGETTNLSLPGGSIANPSTRAMDSYLSDLQRIEISSRLPDLAPEGTLAKRLDTICENILLDECDQIDLLQQYYHLGECLVEIAGSLEGS